MPYYGSNAGNFSSGLMAGFSFVENIAQQRERTKLMQEEVKQREADNKRADEYLAIQQAQARRVEEDYQAKKAREPGEHRVDSQNLLFETVGKGLAAKLAEVGDVKKLSKEDQRKVELIGYGSPTLGSILDKHATRDSQFAVQDHAWQLQERTRLAEAKRQGDAARGLAEAFTAAQPEATAPTPPSPVGPTPGQRRSRASPADP